ncbi:MAG: hypothetical protein QOG26_961 [Solirubrobacterales bacterium]|jgi:hypothetical protein|nr:hypothetical protein [Solirubrobacterales bacterium]MDX6651592.1 hypothetical protein [Solirubrobacterales bacterium]
MRPATRHPRGSRTLLATSLATIVATTALIAVPAASIAANLVTLGVVRSNPAPSCPSDPCQAVGHVTGFQVSAGTVAHHRKNIFVVPANGQIIKWSIRLSKPNAKQLAFFNSFYGGPPKAALGILRRTSKTAPRFKLMRQSGLEDLTDYMGVGEQTFVLEAPLSVKKGDIVALTIPTWAPAFAVNQTAVNTWRASRPSTKCNGRANIRNGSAHGTVGKTRTYGCLYKGARILYTAGFSPS